MWDEENLPCLKSELKDIINSIDDVTAVSFDTWAVSSDYNIIIEFYHRGRNNVRYFISKIETAKLRIRLLHKM